MELTRLYGKDRTHKLPKAKLYKNSKEYNKTRIIVNTVVWIALFSSIMHRIIYFDANLWHNWYVIAVDITSMQ